MFLSNSARRFAAQASCSRPSPWAGEVARCWISTGTVFKFDSNKGYGFILVDNPADDGASLRTSVFVRAKDVVSDIDRTKLPPYLPYLRKGERVQFDIVESDWPERVPNNTAAADVNNAANSTEEQSTTDSISENVAPQGGGRQRKLRALNVKFADGNPVPAIRKNFLSGKNHETFLGKVVMNIMDTPNQSPEEKFTQILGFYDSIANQKRERETLLLSLGLNPDDYRPEEAGRKQGAPKKNETESTTPTSGKPPP